jgi:alkylhydroperoxidase/carboxymuconolactone decarboxylase family protein YurZ
MSSNSVRDGICEYFDTSQPPLVFDRLQANEAYLKSIWDKYHRVMTTGEITASAKELMGLGVAIAKSSDYVVAFQQQRLRDTGVGEQEITEAVAVTEFFEGFDAFAQSLRVDSDLRPRQLAAGDMSSIDREDTVNVPYVLESEDETVRKVYDEIRSTMRIPFVPNIFKAMAHQPAMLQAKWECYKAIMLGGSLRRLTKELIAIAVSAVNACFY